MRVARLRARARLWTACAGNPFGAVTYSIAVYILIAIVDRPGSGSLYCDTLGEEARLEPRVRAVRGPPDAQPAHHLRVHAAAGLAARPGDTDIICITVSSLIPHHQTF